jgi:osmotically-inducible protein OsmY
VALLRQHPDLGPPNEIDVSTRGGVVYLSGLVATPLQSESAAALAQEIPGVARVVNTVAVEQ